MKHLIDWEPLVCSVDPITLTGLALAGLAGGATAAVAGSGGGGSAAPAAAPPPSMAPPAQAPSGSKGANKSQQPSFVGASAVPNNTSGQKTLLGQ